MQTATDNKLLCDGEASKPPACVDVTWLHWLGELVAAHGAGEYVVRVRVDGSVTVKRPRKPLEFDYRVRA